MDSSAAQKNSPEKLDIRIWNIGLEPKAMDILSTALTRVEVVDLTYDLEKLSEEVSPPPHMILCGPTPPDVSVSEVAQMLRMQYPDSPIYLAAFSREGYDRKTFKKNGFTDAYIFPLDADLAKKDISTHLTQLTNGEIKTFRPVKLLDIAPTEVLNFDTTIYLPMNKRYIKYSNAGKPMGEERLKKLSGANVNSLYVSTDQMGEFYKYTASRLSKTSNDKNLSATERQEKLEESIRTLAAGLFNSNSKDGTFGEGKALMSDLREIANTFICDDPKNDWYKKLIAMMGGQNSSYSHAGNVSTFAALFSVGLGIGKPSELAMAALLHDIGLADIPHEIVNKPEDQRTKEEQEVYKKHPQIGVDIIRAKKLIIPEKVLTVILEHHECFNGSGYPNALVGDRISKESQILALADRFDEMTSIQEGRQQMSPADVVQYFKQQTTISADKAIFDPSLLTGLIKLFPSDS